MKFTEFLIFCIYFLDVFSVEVFQVPEELIPELYSKYLEAVNSEEPQPSLRRVFARNTEYNIHVRKLKEVNGLKRHNLEIKVIGRSSAKSERFYISNPVEAKIPKAFLTLEEFKEVLSNRVNYKSTTKRVLIVRNKRNDSMIIKPNVTTTMKPIKLVRAKNHIKLVKGLPVNKHPLSPTELLKQVQTNPVIKDTLRMNKVIAEDKYSINNVTTKNILSISTTEIPIEFTITKEVTEIKSSLNVTSSKIEDITTDLTAESRLSYEENTEDLSTNHSENETTVTDNTPTEVETNIEYKEATERTEVETTTKRSTKRSSLSRPLVFEMDNVKEQFNGYDT